MNGSDPLLDDLLRGFMARDTLAVVTEGYIDHIHTLNTGHLYTLLSNNFIFCSVLCKLLIEVSWVKGDV